MKDGAGTFPLKIKDYDYPDSVYADEIGFECLDQSENTTIVEIVVRSKGDDISNQCLKSNVSAMYPSVIVEQDIYLSMTWCSPERNINDSLGIDSMTRNCSARDMR